MSVIKILISVLLFLSSLVFPTGTIEVWATIGYVGVLVPFLLQKMWFGHWLEYEGNKQLWKNILFSCLFIIASVFATDIFIMMMGVIDKSGYNLTNILLVGINRVFFFFAIVYLWNYKLFEQKSRVLYHTFKVLQIFYTVLAIPVIIWLLCILSIDGVTVIAKYLFRYM